MLSGISRHYRRKGRRVNVVAFAGDGASADAGFQCLSAAGERGERIIYICYDNEGYMNTGGQRSSTTPPGAHTPTTPAGKTGSAKDLPRVMLGHQIPYLATANPAFLDDFVAKLAQAMATDGFSYLHLFAPCPMGWGFPPSQAIEVCRLAVETDYFPLWEARGGEVRTTWKIKAPRPLSEYTSLLGKFNHLTEEESRELKKGVQERRRWLNAMDAGWAS
jgi:pyruvate/2-oxoacid:ferredoxin oxidoreductase beta subunit